MYVYTNHTYQLPESELRSECDTEQATNEDVQGFWWRLMVLESFNIGRRSIMKDEVGVVKFGTNDCTAKSLSEFQQHGATSLETV